jgi:hypothetical protein
MVILAWLCVAVAAETEEASTEVVQPQVIESMVLVDDGEFWIDSHEVTNAEYARFVASTGHRVPSPVDTGIRGWNKWTKTMPPEGYEQYPVVGIDWWDASSYCDGRGSGYRQNTNGSGRVKGWSPTLFCGERHRSIETGPTTIQRVDPCTAPWLRGVCPKGPAHTGPPRWLEMYGSGHATKGFCGEGAGTILMDLHDVQVGIERCRPVAITRLDSAV